VITGPGSRVGRMIVEHPGIDKVAFTGDTPPQGDHEGSADTLKHHPSLRQVAEHRFPDADLDAAQRRDDWFLRQG
jgi:hypothetical protein